RRRRVVPHDHVIVRADQHRDAHLLAGWRVIIMAAVDRMPAKVQVALLVLPETVEMLAWRDAEVRADLKRFFAVHRLWRHFPATHLERLSVRAGERQRYRWQRRNEIALHLTGRVGPGLSIHGY